MVGLQITAMGCHIIVSPSLMAAKERCARVLYNALFQHFYFISGHLALLQITTPSRKLRHLATNHRVVEMLIANGQSSHSIIRIMENRHQKVIPLIANLSLPSPMTLGRKHPLASDDVVSVLCGTWLKWLWVQIFIWVVFTSWRMNLNVFKA